jgi:hypothetical protein
MSGAMANGSRSHGNRRVTLGPLLIRRSLDHRLSNSRSLHSAHCRLLKHGLAEFATMLPTGSFLRWRVRCGLGSSVCCSARERRHFVKRLRQLPQALTGCGRLRSWPLRLQGISASFHRGGTLRLLYRRGCSSSRKCPKQRPARAWAMQRSTRR